MYIYISFVLYFTMMPIVKNIPFMINHFIYHFGSNMNMNLFDDLFNQRGDYLRQTFLNVLMMVPCGIMGYIFYLIFKPLINKIFVKRSNV